MKSNLKILVFIAWSFVSSQAFADNNDNSNNRGRISEDNISQSQANPKH